LHPAIQISIDDPSNFLVTPADILPEGFTFLNAILLVVVITLVISTMAVVSHSQICLKFLNFFIVEQPYTKLELQPIETIKRSLKPVTSIRERLRLAVVGKHMPLTV
jgi:hypothetical protein